MATNVSQAEKPTDSTAPDRLQQSDRGRIRPHHIFLGVDERGAHHIYQTTTETIHIVHDDGSRGRRLLDGGDVDDYMDAVADAHGWAVERYGQSLGDMIVETLR